MASSLELRMRDARDAVVPDAVRFFKLYDVRKHIFGTNHMWFGYFLTANISAWNVLPSDIQTAVESNAAKYAVLEQQDRAAGGLSTGRCSGVKACCSATQTPRPCVPSSGLTMPVGRVRSERRRGTCLKRARESWLDGPLNYFWRYDKSTKSLPFHCDLMSPRDLSASITFCNPAELTARR